MLDFLKRKVQRRDRMVDVGWVIDSQQGGFVWHAPQRLLHDDAPIQHAKSVRNCPAVLDHEGRIFEVLCPVDLHVRFQFEEKTKEPRLINAAGDLSTVRPKHLGQLITLIGRKEWRDPNRPIIQIITPYLFLADEPVYMTQLPPFAHYRAKPWPGLMIGGRLPVHIWPRHMMWAFEWMDPTEDLILKRGEPWFYVRFETEDPSRPVRLIEAEMTPALREYVSGLSGVTNYMNRTFSLFAVARDRRPKSLLIRKQR